MSCGRDLHVSASERDTARAPSSGGVLWATDVEEVDRTGAVRDGCSGRVWEPHVNGAVVDTTATGGGSLQMIQRSPRAGVIMDPGEYSKL